MRSIIRIDIDKGFGSWDALREAIEGVGLPPPNLAVAHVEDDGRVVNPHASGCWRRRYAARRKAGKPHSGCCAAWSARWSRRWILSAPMPGA